MLLAIQDEAWRFGRYIKYVLRRININPSRIRFGFRSSFAAVGFVGRRPRWIRYMSRPQRRGPSYVRTRIPLLIRKFILGTKWLVPKITVVLCRGGKCNTTIDYHCELHKGKITAAANSKR